jgi:hypothetical protein
MKALEPYFRLAILKKKLPIYEYTLDIVKIQVYAVISRENSIGILQKVVSHGIEFPQSSKGRLDWGTDWEFFVSPSA